MTTRRRFYDVVVVGGTLSALATGALLARRGFRVTAVGHGALASSYSLGGFTLRRSLSTLCVADTPAFRRVFAELALLPAARRRVSPLSPAWQMVLPRHRVDVHPEPEPMLAELVREFPDLQRPMEDFLLAASRGNELAGSLFAEEVSWPPRGFFERRRLTRHLRASPFGADGAEGELLDEFAATHPFRVLVEAQLRFQSALAPEQLSSLARARLHGLGLRASLAADGGVDELRQMLEEKIQQHGGDLRLRDRVERFECVDGAVRGVRVEGTDEVLGCAFVISSLDAEATLRLAHERATKGYSDRLAATVPSLHRYVINAVLPSEALPVGMGRRIFLVGDPARALLEENLLAIEVSPADALGHSTITASALLPRTSVDEGAHYLEQLRARVLGRLRALVPFFDENWLLIDSPHDGVAAVDRRLQLGAAPRPEGPEAMTTLDHHPSLGPLRLFGVPSKTPVAGVFTVNRQSMPALGLEGELLTALSVAEAITRTDRRKERMRRELWSKVET